MVAGEVKFCECRKSPNNVAFYKAVKLSRVSQALSVWPFSVLLYWKVWTHPLLLCSFPVHSLPVAQWQLRTKNTALLFSLYIFFPLVSPPPFFHSFLVKLGLVKAQSTYFCNKQRHSESLQVSRESCQVWGFSVFFLFFLQGWKDVSSLAEEYAFVGCRRLTHCRSFGNKPGWLYSPDPGCFFSPLFFTLKIQAGPIQILALSIFILISRELPGIPPIGKFAI